MSPVDPYTAGAATQLGISPLLVTPAQRQAYKLTQLAKAYEASPQTIARMLAQQAARR